MTAATGESFERFVAVEGDALLRFAFLATGGRAADAEDVVQTVLLRLAKRGLRGLENPAAYCRRSVLNECASASRKATVALRALPRLIDREHDDPTATVDSRLALLGALRMLSGRERHAIVLRFFEGWDDAAIADAIGCSQPTVRSLVHRALPKLRSALERSTNQFRSEGDGSDV